MSFDAQTTKGGTGSGPKADDCQWLPSVNLTLQVLSVAG